MSANSSLLLDISNLTVSFSSQEGKVLAVDNLNLQLHEGETLGIVGESGSGKSITSLALMGLVPRPAGCIDDGTILYNGRNMLTLSNKELKRIYGNEISMIFQEPMTSLNPILTCGFQVAESLRLHKKLSKNDAKAEAVHLLDLVGIPQPEKSVKRFPHQLSGGMRQRVMIAMALACSPKILIADEPTTALDVTIQAQILDLMRGLSQERNTSIIMITHDLGVVADIADRVMVMYTGHSVESASTKELFENPLHPYTKGLLASIPKITKERHRLEEISGMVPNPTDERKGCTFHSRCGYITDKCKRTSPQLLEYEPGHFVRCWLYEKESNV